MTQPTSSDQTRPPRLVRESFGYVLLVSYVVLAGSSLWLQVDAYRAATRASWQAEYWSEEARNSATLAGWLSQAYAAVLTPAADPQRQARLERAEGGIRLQLERLKMAVSMAGPLPEKQAMESALADLSLSTSQLLARGRLPALTGAADGEADAEAAGADFEEAMGRFEQIHQRMASLARSQQIVHGRGVGEGALLAVAMQGLLLLTIGGLTTFLWRFSRRIGRDVSENRQLAEQLRAGDVRYRAIFDNAVEGIFQITPEGRFLAANGALARMCGYDSPEALMTAAGDSAGHLYADPSRRAALLAALATQEVVTNFQFELVRPDGRTVWLREKVRAVRDPAGTLLYMEGIAEDISEEWWAERLRRLRFAASRELSESPSVAEARPRVLQIICELLQWDLGVLWDVDRAGWRLEMGDAWQEPKGAAGGFDGAAVLAACRFGSELAGEVWRTGEPGVVENFESAMETPEATELLRAGARSALAVPVKVHGEVLHVVEFFSRRVGAPDAELVRTLQAVGEEMAHVLEVQRAAEALRKSEMRKAAILKSAFDCIISFDASGRVTEFNPAAERTFGYAAQEVLGREMIDLLLPETRRNVHRRGLDMYTASSESRNLRRRRIELQAVRKDGKEFPVEVAISRMKIDGRVMFTAFVRDLSERRDAERITAELAAVVANSNDAIIACTREGLIRSWNAGAERIFGYRAEEVTGRSMSVLFPPERLDEFAHTLAALERGQSLVNYETVRMRKDGKKISVSLTDSPIRSESGEVTGLSSIVRDITERKRLEEDLLQSQKMDAVGRLAGGIAHDFNNVLTAILGYCELIIGQTDERQWLYKHLLEIRNAADFAASLTQQLLAFSRRQPLYLRVFSINDRVRGLQQMLQRVIGERIHVVIDLRAGSGCLKADPSQIEQVLLNLCVNARDAMTGGGTLTITTEDVSYFLDDFYAVPEMPAGEYVKLTVADTGAGMSKEVIKHIFEPFFTTKPEGQGTGLGLATCYGIVKQSGGYLSVDSAPGLGTTFSVYLPRVDERGEKVALPNASSRLPGGRETILYVEDEISLRSLTAQVLRGLGYTVLEAGDGQAARELVEGGECGRIDLLFSDVVLPDAGGRAIAQWFESRSPQTKILFTSGYTDEVLFRDHGLDASCPFLQKPFTPSELALKVRALLDGAQGVAAAPAEARQ